jgi:vacuolar-type H+-ATPase subunit F/Vma7
MGKIVAVGERNRIQGYSIAGVEAVVAGTAADSIEAWRRLPRDVAVLILTSQAAAAIGDRIAERPDVLIAVLP